MIAFIEDQRARANDQRPDSGADLRAAQQDQRCGEPTDRQRCDSHPGDPATREECRKGRGVCGQATDIIEEASDRGAEWPGAAGHGRHGIRDRFKGGSRSDRHGAVDL